MGSLAILAGLGLALLALVPVPQVTEVEVIGAHHLAAATIALRSGLRGEPVFRASAADARRLVLTLPAVQEATVVLVLPDRARITVRERAAVARWILGGDEWFVDAEGVLFGSADPAAAPQVRIADDRAATRACAGTAGARCVDPALLAAALRLAAIGPGELRSDVRSLQVRIDRTEAGLVLRTGGGWEIRFGGPEDLERKLELVRRFLREQPTRRLDYLDVRSPERIVFSPQ